MSWDAVAVIDALTRMFAAIGVVLSCYHAIKAGKRLSRRPPPRLEQTSSLEPPPYRAEDERPTTRPKKPRY